MSGRVNNRYLSVDFIPHLNVARHVDIIFLADHDASVFHTSVNAYAHLKLGGREDGCFNFKFLSNNYALDTTELFSKSSNTRFHRSA